MQRKPGKIANIETLGQEEKPKKCSLKAFLAKSYKGGFILACKGPNKGNGVIKPGQEHYVVRTSRKKKIVYRCCGIECYDEFRRIASLP